MSSKQETIEDIVAALRNEGHAGDESCLEWVGENMRTRADRIEAAHQREVAELEREVAELRACLKMAVVNARIARTCYAFGRECDSCGQSCDARKWNKVIEATKGYLDMKASEMTNEELAECIESARIAPAKCVREGDLNFHSEAIREAAARLRNLGEIGEAVVCKKTREKSSLVGNAAEMLEALEAVVKVGYPHNFQKEAYHIREYCYEITTAIKKCFAALSSPPRNCDRPECATTKAAQDVWRKEDGGKTAYYEWLLQQYKEGESEVEG